MAAKIERMQRLFDTDWLHRLWPYLRRLLTLAFFLLVAYLLYSQVKNVEWTKVKQGLLDYSPGFIAAALLASAATFLAYSCYDLFGYHYVKPPFSRRRAMLVGFISYAFNLNLGAIVGSVGFRYRIYSRLGLGNADIARITSMSIATNWLGYLMLAGTVFSIGSLQVPDSWRIGNTTLQFVGVGFLLLVAGYLALCYFSTSRVWTVRGHEFPLPSIRIALLQLVNASCHWTLMASIIYMFLHHEIGFIAVFVVLLASAVAGAVTHVPGALGVLEVVFVGLLGAKIDKSTILAALIAYRAIFYLLPLAVATVAYLSLEASIGKSGKKPKHSKNATTV